MSTVSKVNKYEEVADRVVDAIISSGLVHSTCVVDKRHRIQTVWSGHVNEQLSAVIRDALKGMK